MNVRSHPLCALLMLGLAAGCTPPRKADPCSTTDCGNGTCTAAGSLGFCTCDPGSFLQNNTCVTQGPQNGNVCAPNPCSGGKACSVANGTAQCACPQGQVEDGSHTCVAPSVCAPNPCTTVAHQTVCTVMSGAAKCSCESGYMPSGNTCVGMPMFDCSKNHSGNGEDGSEPNECPTFATSVTLAAAPMANTIYPVGDVDWLKVKGAPGHIIEVSVSDSSLTLAVDVFGKDGTTSLGSNHRGEANPVVRFMVPFNAGANDPIYVRVSALSATEWGDYAVSAADLGTDDYANFLNGAQPITAGGSFSGDVQYDNDVDFAAISAVTTHTYSFTLSSGTDPNVLVELLAADGTTVLKTLSLSAPTASLMPTGSWLYLRAKGSAVGDLGAFSVTTSDDGSDDYGNDVANATSVTVSGLATNGSWERSGDVDVLSLTATAQHLYALSCSSFTNGCRVSVTTSSGTVLANNASSSTANVTFQLATTSTVYVQLTPYVTGTGTYTFTITDLGADDYGDSSATASPVTVGTTLSGGLQTTTDHDFFSVTTSAGHSYTVTCTSSASYLCAMQVKTSLGTSLGYSSYGYGSPTNVSFTTTTADTVFVDVYGSSSTGTYSLVVTDLGGDDHGDTTATATALTLGTAKAGQIQFSGDRDVFSFTATASKIYAVTCTTSASYLCTLNVKNASGTSVGSSSYGTSTNVGFVAATAGTYTVEVSSSYSSYTGAYTLTVTNTGSDDFGDTTTTAGTITVGTPVSGNIQFSLDKDVMAFTGTTNHIYSVTCTTSASYLCALTVRNPSGTAVTTASYGTSTVAGFTANPSGTWTVEVGASYSGYTGAYTLTVTDTGTDDYGDTPSAAGTITVGTTASGNIQFGGDKDVMAFTTTTSKLYTITCTTSVSYGCMMTVRDSGQNSVITSSYGATTTATFKALNTGPYTVEVRTYYTTTTGAFTVKVVDSGSDDHGDTTGTGTAITAGASAKAGNIEVTGDKDVFVFTATQGTVYHFTCTTTNYDLCNLTARDASLTTIATAYYSTSSVVTFKAATAGQHSIEVSGYTGYTGTYSVLLTALTDDFGDTPAAGSALTLGSTKTGNLDYASDVDYFTVTLTASTTYTVTVNPSGTPFTIYDPSLAAVTLSAGHFTATTSGTYYVRVAASASYQGPYSVLVQ